jgi:hypothetical protein
MLHLLLSVACFHVRYTIANPIKNVIHKIVSDAPPSIECCFHVRYTIENPIKNVIHKIVSDAPPSIECCFHVRYTIENPIKIVIHRISFEFHLLSRAISPFVIYHAQHKKSCSKNTLHSVTCNET